MWEEGALRLQPEPEKADPNTPRDKVEETFKNWKQAGKAAKLDGYQAQQDSWAIHYTSEVNIIIGIWIYII